MVKSITFMDIISITSKELQRSFEQLGDMNIDKLEFYINHAQCWSIGNLEKASSFTSLHKILYRLHLALLDEAKRRQDIIG